MREITFYKCHPNAVIPTRATEKSVGYDLYALDDYEFIPGQVSLVRTGIVATPPFGYFLELSLRSGFSIKNPGLVLANGIGIIDPDFSGPTDEICVIILNTRSGLIYNIEKGQRIAQLTLRESIIAGIREGNIEDLKNTKNRSGFGHSGDK